MFTKPIPVAYQAAFYQDIARLYSGKEVFLPIPGLPGYEISDFGRIISRKRQNAIFRTPQRHRQGYLLVGLIAPDGTKHQEVVHRLVMLAHKGQPPLDEFGQPYVVCHENGVEWDCRLRNLRYDTRASNMADKLKHGTSTRKVGTMRPVTEDIVEEILTDFTSTTKEQAAKYGLSPRIIGTIKNGLAYRHLCLHLPRRKKSTRTPRV